jgi:hypothetical protein
LVRTNRERRFTLGCICGPTGAKSHSNSEVAWSLLCAAPMHPRRRNPVKAALLAFPVFYLGGIALTLHGGPCPAACHHLPFWPAALGGPLLVGFLAAAFPRVGLSEVSAEEAQGLELELEAE